MGQCNNSRDPQDRLVQEELEAAKHVALRDHRLLLLGPGSSGKSTFFKQLCQIHGNGFQAQDIEQARQNISYFIIQQMKRLVQQCIEHINHQEEHGVDDGGYHYTFSANVQKAADSVLDIQPRGIVIHTENANLIKTLWNDPSIKHTFKTRTNLSLTDSAPLFFEDIHRISNTDYVPTDEDILLVRVPTSGVRSASFFVKQNKFTLIDVGGQRNERSKWIHQFSIVDAVLFVASLSCYDQNLFEEDATNAMEESINLFRLVLDMRYFRATSMILFLNKLDLFEIKIKTKSIKKCFPNYKGEDCVTEPALKFISKVFKMCATESKERQLIYTHVTCATDSTNVEKVFRDVEHTVISRSLESVGL